MKRRAAVVVRKTRPMLAAEVGRALMATPWEVSRLASLRRSTLEALARRVVPGFEAVIIEQGELVE